MKKYLKILAILFLAVAISFSKEIATAGLIHEDDGNGGVTGYVVLTANNAQGEITVNYGETVNLYWNVTPFTDKYLPTMNLTQYLERITCTGTGGLFVSGSFYKGTEIKPNLTSSKNYGITCTDIYGNKGTSTVKVNVRPQGQSVKGHLSDLFVSTGEATNITYSTATLEGYGGDSIAKPTLPIAAYFRYSKAEISPIFCNDIYGTNMVSTKDKSLGIPFSSDAIHFSTSVSNLTPDTTYYYCAIVSNKENIAYGGTSIVKKFHTSPFKTTIKTSSATDVDSISAILNGSFSSIQDVTTYFQYKKYTNDGTISDWIQSHSIQPHHLGNNANIYGNISANLSGLSKNTTYQFRAVAVTNSGAENKIIYGSTLYFTTTGEGVGNGGGSNDGGTTSACRYPLVLDKQTNTCVQAESLALPTLTVKATPSTILSGEASVISWKAENVTSCTAAGGEVDKIGAFTTPILTKSKSYSVTCIGANGRISGYATVYVSNSTSGVPPGLEDTTLPTVTVTANPYNISAGQTSTISWESTGANSCDAGVEETGKNGSFTTERLNKSRSYSVICTGTNGQASGYAYVNVGNSTVRSCTNGATNPPACTTNANSCVNGATNYPLCTTNDRGACINGATNPPTCNPKQGEDGTWNTGTDSGTWRTTSGTIGARGTSITWTGNGDGTGTWRSTTGSGTWSNGKGTGGAGTGTWTDWNKNNNTGIIDTDPLKLGQTATPPNDAIVRYHEGIETVFVRQIINDREFAKLYGYVEGNDIQTFAWDLADQLARMFGYVSENGREIRVSLPDVAAYQLQMIGDKVTVYEYYENKIVDIRNVTSVFKDASGYEYYFKK